MPRRGRSSRGEGPEDPDPRIVEEGPEGRGYPTDGTPVPWLQDPPTLPVHPSAHRSDHPSSGLVRSETRGERQKDATPGRGGICWYTVTTDPPVLQRPTRRSTLPNLSPTGPSPTPTPRTGGAVDDPTGGRQTPASGRRRRPPRDIAPQTEGMDVSLPFPFLTQKCL